MPTFSTLLCRVCRSGVLAAIWLGLAVPAWGGEALRISGTGDALGALGMLAEAYMREHSGNTIKVLPSVGSAGAIKGVGLKRLEVGVTGRPLTSEERAQGLAEVQYAATPTVIAVGADRPLKSITRQQLADLYAGRTLAWPDGVPVRPVMRRLNESNFEKMMSLSPAVQQAVRAAEQRHGLPYASSDQEMADLLEREQHILTQRRLIDDPQTLEDLSQQYGVSRERVRQIEVRAFEKLQKAMLRIAGEKRLLPAPV